MVTTFEASIIISEALVKTGALPFSYRGIVKDLYELCECINKLTIKLKNYAYFSIIKCKYYICYKMFKFNVLLTHRYIYDR